MLKNTVFFLNTNTCEIISSELSAEKILVLEGKMVTIREEMFT